MENPGAFGSFVKGLGEAFTPSFQRSYEQSRQLEQKQKEFDEQMAQRQAEELEQQRRYEESLNFRNKQEERRDLP